MLESVVNRIIWLFRLVVIFMAKICRGLNWGIHLELKKGNEVFGKVLDKLAHEKNRIIFNHHLFDHYFMGHTMDVSWFCMMISLI